MIPMIHFFYSSYLSNFDAFNPHKLFKICHIWCIELYNFKYIEVIPKTTI